VPDWPVTARNFANALRAETLPKRRKDCKMPPKTGIRSEHDPEKRIPGFLATNAERVCAEIMLH
jgi:hypothetical protein